MITINFNYSGSVNNEAIRGQGTLTANPDTGSIDATINFQEFPETWTPYAPGASLVSLSCSNAAVAEDYVNIYDLSNGDYSSIREIQAFDADGAFLGTTILNGHFVKQSDGVLQGDVVVSGTYQGSVDLELISGYSLPVQPEGEFSLNGEFEAQIPIRNGGHIRTRNLHRYYFNDGTTRPLEAFSMNLEYSRESSWDSNTKRLILKGTSIITQQ